MDSKKEKAIALCRVSSDEQLKNHSLARQNKSVMKMAEKLGVTIPENYTWSGSVSSKCGKNMKRKDLMEIYDACKHDKNIKYVIVDEPDRFMRSIKEAFAWEAKFEEIGVKVMYTDEQLNGDDMLTKMQRFMKYFQAESSNLERINKSIEGHKNAIKEGRYTFVPPLGYRRGRICGIPEIDPVIGPLLKTQLLRIADGLVSPTVALQDYNRSIKLAGIKKVPLKMDKWRGACMNPFHCGIIEVHKAVNASNPNGLHEKLITKKQHEKIVEAFNGKPKNQKGPNAAGNPLYPFNQMITHVGCPCTKSKYNTFVGVTVKNSRGKEYEKYRCRGCYMYISREEMRDRIRDIVSSMELTKSGDKALKEALNVVFEAEEGDIAAREAQLKSQRANAEKEADGLMDAFANAKEVSMREHLEKKHAEIISRINAYDKEINELGEFEALEKLSFCKFALDFVGDLVHNVLALPPEEMQVCKQLLFPDGFFVDENKNVYTQNISPIYRLRTTKKGSDEPSSSLVVRMKRL